MSTPGQVISAEMRRNPKAIGSDYVQALEAGGYAVVELAQSDGVDDDGQEYFDDFSIRVDHTARRSEHPRIYIDGRPTSVEAVRRDAAALLAAAKAAEEPQ